MFCWICYLHSCTLSKVFVRYRGVGQKWEEVVIIKLIYAMFTTHTESVAVFVIDLCVYESSFVSAQASYTYAMACGQTFVIFVFPGPNM